MPRLLPRLLEALRKSHYSPTTSVSSPRRSRLRDVPQSTKPTECPPLSPEGRTQSIILDSLDPILALRRYRPHKSPAPRLRATRPRRRKAHVDYGRGHDAEVQTLRAMTEEERTFWASPYLRMVGTPLRRCIFTRRLMPKAFLVRIAPVRLSSPPPSKPIQILIPDGIEHPSLSPRKTGQGRYILCRRAVVEQLLSAGGFSKRIGGHITPHAWLGRHISHLLRVRVLQELRLLEEHLRRHPRGAQDHPLLRRLTRAEWKQMKSSGLLPYKNAIAVLVVPPLNRNPVTKLRPEPSVSATPPPAEEYTENGIRRSRPLSTLLVTDDEPLDPDSDLTTFVPRSRVPLYNGASLFPYRPHRAALHAILLRLLDVERQARSAELARSKAVSRKVAAGNGQAVPSPEKRQFKRALGDEKGSHAFLVCSDANTLLRADTVPLAMALWRIRIWEGAGWEGSDQSTDGWMLN